MMKIFQSLSLIFMMIPLVLPASSNHEYIYHQFEYSKSSIAVNSNIMHADQIYASEKRGHIKFQKEKREMQANGYAYSTMEDPQGIFSIEYTQWNEFPTRKQRASDIKLAFPYSGLHFISDENNMGYYETYIYKQGWLGIGQYFKDDGLGICNYERLNLKLSTASIRLIQEDLTYVVNNKPTQYIVRGSDETGFSAYVDWYDETYIHQLQCGSKQLHADFIHKAIDLAVRIDQI